MTGEDEIRKGEFSSSLGINTTRGEVMPEASSSREVDTIVQLWRAPITSA